MESNDERKTLYFKTDASGMSLRAGLLQVRGGMSCLYNDAPENEALCTTCQQKPIKYGNQIRYTDRDTQQAIHHRKISSLMFFHEVSIIKDHKPSVAISKKNVASLSQWLQHILLHRHQYKIHILCKPRQEHYITDWLSKQNHCKNKDEEISRMNLGIDVRDDCPDIPECMSTQEIWDATQEDNHLQALMAYIINGWPMTEAEVKHEIHLHWIFYGDLAVTAGVALKYRRTIYKKNKVLKGSEKTGIFPSADNLGFSIPFAPIIRWVGCRRTHTKLYTVIFIVQVGRGRLISINQIGATFWHQVAQYLSHSQQAPCISSAHMALPSTMLSAWHPIFHTSHNTGVICSVYNFDKYSICHNSEGAMLFVMVKVCLYLEIFLFFRTIENFVLLKITMKQNEKLTSTEE